MMINTDDDVNYTNKQMLLHVNLVSVQQVSLFKVDLYTPIWGHLIKILWTLQVADSHAMRMRPNGHRGGTLARCLS